MCFPRADAEYFGPDGVSLRGRKGFRGLTRWRPLSGSPRRLFGAVARWFTAVNRAQGVDLIRVVVWLVYRGKPVWAAGGTFGEAAFGPLPHHVSTSPGEWDRGGGDRRRCIALAARQVFQLSSQLPWV